VVANANQVETPTRASAGQAGTEETNTQETDMNHFHAIDPQGNAHTRSSATRVYTHMVVIKLGQVYADRKLAERIEHTKKQGPKDYRFYLSVIDGTWFTKNGWAINSADQAKYTAKLAGRTLEQYMADRLAQLQVEWNKEVAIGEYDRYGSLGWCGRHDLAQKLASKGGAAGYQGVESIVILEAQVGKPMKKAA
jgi:hypothetical protein